MAKSTPPDSQFSPGDHVAGVTLLEPIARGQRITCWRGKWSDGGAATAHVLHTAAKNREQDNFFGGARALQSLQRTQNLPGVARVAALSPPQLTYVCRVSAAGTVEDVPILQWGVRDTVRFVRKLCHAMHQLHVAGIHHGCMRPANVLLDDDLSPVMSDVGMLVIDDSFTGSSEMKHDYSAYASREVRIGHPANVRSDVFSLGRLLYFCVHGETPDEPDDELPLLATLEYAPAGLVRIIRRCTTRDPTRRYGSITELLDDLDRYEDAENVGLTHPRGREGDTNPVTDRAPDSERPSLNNELAMDAPTDGVRSRIPEAAASGRGTTPAAPASRRPNARKASSAPGPTFGVTRGAYDDVLSVTQARVTGVAGAVLTTVAIALAYYRGPSTAAVVCCMVGAVALSAWVPPFGAPWLSRALVAVFFGVAAWLLDPVTMADEAGRVDRFAEGNPTVRGQRVLNALRAGRNDFTKLDLRKTTFEGMDLSGARFDNSNLGGANFARATLHDTSFGRATITDVDFRGADVSSAELDIAIDWIFSICDESTRLPESWTCNEEGHPVSTAGLDVARANGADGAPERRRPRDRRRRSTFGDDGLEGNLGKALPPPPPAATGTAAASSAPPNQPARNDGR